MKTHWFKSLNNFDSIGFPICGAPWVIAGIPVWSRQKPTCKNCLRIEFGKTKMRKWIKMFGVT
jgi:hypothetical protein